MARNGLFWVYWTRPAIFLVVLAFMAPSLFPNISHGSGSASESYSIPTSVFSGGGRSMASAAFKADSTIGQASPLLDPFDPPYSDSYDLYPGFWYTLDAGAGCPDLACFAAGFGQLGSEPGYSPGCDLDHNGDMDGTDLALFISRP